MYPWWKRRPSYLESSVYDYSDKTKEEVKEKVPKKKMEETPNERKYKPNAIVELSRKDYGFDDFTISGHTDSDGYVASMSLDAMMVSLLMDLRDQLADIKTLLMDQQKQKEKE